MDGTTKTYVQIEAIEGPRIRGVYDTYIVPWSDLLTEVDLHLDDVEDGVQVILGFTTMKMNDAEYRQYCADHEIEEE